MSDAYYVRYWYTKEDYVAWDYPETDYFRTEAEAKKFIETDLKQDDPVFAYELGNCDEEDGDHENHEPYEFYNAEKDEEKNSD